MIYIEHNYTADNGLTGTWCTYEVGERIDKAEYEAAYERATSGDFTGDFSESIPPFHCKGYQCF